MNLIKDQKQAKIITPQLISRLAQINLFLKLFGLFKVPLIAYVNPKVIYYDGEKIDVRIKLKRRTKNHLNSMYFGVLAIGADIAGGIIAMKMAHERKYKISLAFKALSAQFLKRPERDVVFSCHDGAIISDMIELGASTGERVNKEIEIIAKCPGQFQEEPVATFKLTISIKVIS